MKEDELWETFHSMRIFSIWDSNRFKWQHKFHYHWNFPLQWRYIFLVLHLSSYILLALLKQANNTKKYHKKSKYIYLLSLISIFFFFLYLENEGKIRGTSYFSWKSEQFFQTAALEGKITQLFLLFMQHLENGMKDMKWGIFRHSSQFVQIPKGFWLTWIQWACWNLEPHLLTSLPHHPWWLSFLCHHQFRIGIFLTPKTVLGT